MPDNVDKLFEIMQANGAANDRNKFRKVFLTPGNKGYKIRKDIYDGLRADGIIDSPTYEDFRRKLRLGGTPTVNKYRQQMFNSVDPNKNGLNALSHRAVSQAKRAMNNVRKPVTAKVVDKKGKPTGEEFAITPAKTVEDLDREYAQETTKNWENELHDQMADADKDAAKISDMFKSFIGSTDEVGSVWGNMTRGGGIAGTPHSVTTNNGILENTETRQLLAAGDYNRKRKELLQLEQDSRNGATFDNHSFFRGMYDAAKDTGILTGGASDLINAGSLLATKQDLDNGVHTKAGDMLMQQAVKNSNAQSQYGDNQGWMYTGGVITTNMAPFMVQIGSAGFSKGMSNAIGKVVQGAASKVALGTMEKATGMAGAHIANYIGKVTGLTTKAFGKAIQYGIVGAAQANTVGLGNVANDVINRYTGQVYQDEQGNYKFGTFDSDGNLVHEGGEDFLTAFVKGDAAQTIEFATELAGGGIDAAGTALKNFVTKGGKKIINKYNMENVSKVINFLLNNKVAKNARYLKAGADRTLGKVEVNSIVGESLEEELGIIANTVFTGDNKISDLWDEKQQSQIWGGMLLSIGLMKGAVAPFHAYNAKQYYSYKHKLNKADVNLSQLLGKEKWEELRNQIDATTNEDMPEMVNKINRDVALGKNRQPVREYIQNLLIMRGYDIGNMLAAKKAVEDKGEGVSVKNMEKNQAYQQGRDAYGYDTHEIQLDQEDKQKSLAQLLGISEQQLASMSDEELESFSGRDDNIDRAIYDYQLSSARYEGVVDNARDQIDLEVQRAAQAVDMYTDKSRNTIRNATIKASGGLEDYGVYIISGNIATHDDGSIDVSNSDDMILYYDPTTNTVEHADAMMFAELGSEENADEVRSQAMADAKEKAIKETTGIIDGVVEVGTQFKTVDADGTEHTYEVLADNGDGTAMITIDGNIPTELVKGENVNIPVSFEELQKMKDESDQQRLQAAKAQREQMENERAEQQMQAQTTQAENPAQENNIQSAPIEDNIDYSDIIREDGKVQMVDVSDKDGNNLFPDAKDVFYIQGNKMRTKFVYIDANGELKTQSFPTGLVKIKTRGEVSVDDYKKYRNTLLSAESSAIPESSMIEDNSGENRGEIEVESPTIEGETAGSAEETAAPEATETPETEQTPATPAITLEDGTIVPMLEDGNPDFSKLTAEQTAELYDNQFGEDADSVISSWVSDAKKALDKANNMTVKGKTFVEQKAAKDAKEKAIADAQAAYDSAIAIRDAYNNRQLAKAEGTPEGRRSLVEKARRKFARLKSAVKDDAEAVSQLYRETIGSLLHRLYDGTGIDVTDTVPLTAEEYVASNLGAHSLNYEGNETSKGVKQETGLSREDFAKTQLLAADGKGTTIDALVHSLWDNRPSNLESLDTQDIRNALIDVLTSGFKASEARSYIENIRIAQAEKLLEEQELAAENAAYAEQQKAKEEEEKKKAELEKKAEEEKKKAEEEKTEDNENTEFPDKLKEGSKAIEVPEDATDENPLGLQLSEDKVPFEIEGGKSGETYNINDDEDRQRLINDNKVDDKDILDIDMPKHVHKAIKELCKKMGLKVQFLYMGARSNGWIENGTMYLALDTEKATQFVFGHEMTHAIKQKNPEAYKELVKVAMAVTTKKKFEEDLAKVYQNYHGISGYNNVDDFVEEVIADNIGKFINDHDLAQRFVLRLNHPVLATILHAIQKIKGLLYGDPYKSVDALERIVEKAYVDTANGQVTNSETGEDVSFSLRQKPEPKKKGIGYKVFVLKDGKLYPPMVANPDGAATPVGVWLDADAAPIAGESKTGRPQVKQGGKGTQGGSGKLAYRPGWHLGVVPYAIQFNRKDAEGNKTLFPKNFVFAEVEYAADVDYQEEARQEGINPSGKYQHSLAGLKHLPTDGYYMYRTNPNPETDPWVITGAMKVNRILTRAEQAELVKNAGREPQQIQEGDIVTDDVVNSINQEIADAPKFSLKVYHGSGADFTEFDFDHMGEGAGSQVFGWGGYVTSSKKIGKSYAKIGQMSAEDRHRHASSEDTPIEAAVGSILGQEIYNERAKTFEQKKAQAIENAENSIASYSDMLKNSNELDEKSKKFLEKSIERYKKELEVLRALTEEQYKEEYIKQGRAKNLYEVDIPDDNGSNYLDWENPLNEEQINTIRDALAKNGVDVSSWENRGFKLDLPFKDVYAAVLPMMMRCEPKEVSKFLSSLGFTGIKYPAGTIQGGAEEGDTNYVIFKPEDMKITQHTKFSLRLKSAIEETETNPSDAQKESGNYKKGHIKFGGYDYTIENPKGSTRSGKDANGKEWKITMHDTYGYIRGKFGKDGDHLDMFINDKADLDNWNGDVFVVDQVNPDGSFDEHKVMYGYDSMDDAEKAYLANYSKGWKGLGNITGASKDEFDKWLDTSNRKLKPFADYAKVKFSQAQSVSEPRYSLKDIKPIGVGAFGNIYNQFRGNAKAAIEFLKKVRGGEAVGALHHKDIGDIDLVWGKEGTGHSDGYGLSKLVKYHPEVLDNLQEILNDMRVVSSSKNRVNLESETHKAGVRLTWDGERKSWLLTAFKKETSASDKRTDTAATSLEGDTALSQTEGSAAKIDNSSETSKENGEKFSLKDEKTMFGMHNISLDKLRKAIKQGGFAAPSMGVIDSKNGIYSGYGEITLIPKAEKIAKRTGKNIGTYAADAWTPIYPPVEKKFGGNGGDVAYDDIESVPKEMQRLTRNAINSFMDGREANGLAYLYLQEKGKAPELVHVEGKYPKELHDEVKGILGKLNGIYNTTDEQKEKLLDLFIREVYDGNKEEFDNDIKKLIKKDEEFIKKRPNSNIAKNKQLDVDWMKEHGYDYGALSRFVDGILRDAETSGKVDENATMKAAQQYIQDKGMKEDFDSWKEKLNDRYNVEEVIFAGYKPDGNRKYLPNTVENAVKVMKQDGKNASVGSASFSHFVASILKPMGTLDQIRKKKGNLTGNYEDVEKFQEKWQPVYDELADKMQPDAEPFESYGMDRLEEVATQKNPKKYAKEEYGVDLTDEDINKLNELIEAVKNDKPSIYFETKFMRPYGLDEFEKAIVPNDTPSDVVDALKMAGIDVTSYERGNAEDRQKVTMDAINSSDNIRFSLKSMMAKPEGWKQANKKAIHIAEAIERDPKFSLKNLDGTLIKAGTYFSGGGLVEEGLKGIIDPVVAVEYDEKISGVYRNNFGQHIVTADVRDVDPRELVKQIDGEVEYFHASPVCKNYSQAKSNHAEVELDKETAASTAEFINAVKPKVVTIENVKGYKDSDAMKTITDALDANGYTWDADVYNAADYGGYTNRERLIVRAVRDGKLPDKPKKMEHKSGWYEAVADIIPTLTEKKNGVAPWMDVRLKADGIDWRNIDKPLYVMGSAYADGKIPHAFADELLPTLRTKSGDVIVMPDGKVYRAMGRVLARVSGVSDDYKMPFSENLSHTIIGNGIPTQLTEHVIAPLLQNTLRPTTPEDGNTKFSIKQFGTDIADASDRIKKLMNNENIISRRIGSRAQAQSRVFETISRASDEFRRSNRASAKSGQDTWEKDRALGHVIRASYGTGSFLTEEEIKEITSGKVGNGQENQVYLSKDGKTVIKLNNLLMVDREFRFNEFLDRIKAHNEFAPDDMYTPLGFALNEDGDFCLVLEQPYVKGEPATQEEIDDYMESHGYDLYPIRVSAEDVGAGWSNGEFEIWDTKPRNVLKDKNGDLHFIDTVIQHAFIDGHNDKLRLSLRGSTPYDKQMEEWMEKNHLEKGAVPMEKPIMKEGENIFDYANRMVEWTRNQNLWKTAPKQTGFQDALEKWKADNGLSPDAYPPVRPHRENYSTEIGYAEDLEEYNKKKDLWKSAPKPKDFDLSVDLEDMNKQLRNIRRAVLNQKNYDQRTVKAVSDLVRKMLNIGWGDGLSRGKVGNLLSAAKNATGANDVKKYLDKAMGILAENYLNRLSTAYDNLINTKGARADQSGVIKIGSLDAKGQAFMSEYKKAINMDDKSLNTYIANIEEDSAKNEDNVEMNDYRLAGIQAAIMYKQQIGGNDADIAELKRQIGELKNKKDATKEDKDLLKSLEKKLFENKFDRITMFENLLNNIQRMVKESKGRAKKFREEIAEHKNEILHRANLDLEGVDSTYYDTTTAKKKLVNNDLQRAVFSSTYTFEQFLKFFGKKSANGEGYLYNYFTKLNQDALDEEQLYNEMNRNALDEKTKELFGKEKFMKLVGIDGKGMKEMDVEVTDYSNKETGKRTIHLKQGQMLYIYLVNKETDGEMKLRAMGITEEDVAAIEENLDPRVKAMGEWLQDEYLPECQRRYQATHTKYFGAHMKEVENYFPLAINNRARNVKEDVNQDSDAMSQLAGTSTGAIVTRRVNVIPLDIENADAFEVAFNHLQEMEEWSAMLPFRQDINTLLSYTHFRNQVQNMSSVAYGSGKTLWDEFKQTAQIAAGTYKPKVNAGMMDSRIAAAMGGIAVAKISGRLWTAIKQSQSATVFLPECDFTRFVKNGVNPYGSWKWAMENIPDFRKRVENMTYGDVKLRQYLDELEKWHDWTKTISKIGMAPNILVDGITCAVGARSVYETEVNRLSKLGYPKEKAEEKAYYKAVAAYNKTQQSSGGMYLSPMQVDRTYASAALSLFKNANYAYGRMQIEACRGLARTYDFWGGKHKTTLIESMTRQIMEEDGLDENTARAIAKATYNRTFRQSIGRLINFATLVPVSWALYKVLPYLLTGDDDDKKKDMIEEAVLKGFATSLSDNYVIPFASNILNAGLKVEDGKPTFDPEVFRYQNLYINPATSDLANIYSMVGNQKWYSVANKLGMLGVQSLIGFNPETVGALYQALSEADYDNGNTAKEWQIGILKAISAPEESIRELYMDELGLKSGDIKKIPLAELEKRYAERQINRDNLLSQIGMDAETFNGYVDKYQKSFEKKIKDKMDKWDEYDKKKADEFFDTTSDPKLKDMIEKKRAKDANAAADEQIAKEGLNQEKKGKEPSEEAYDAVKMSIDVAEDNAISTYNKVLNKRYAALNDEYNEQTDAMKYIFMSKHPNFKAYKELESEYTNYGKKIKELKEKLVSADGYDAKQTILKQIRAEREKFSGLQSKVR